MPAPVPRDAPGHESERSGQILQERFADWPQCHQHLGHTEAGGERRQRGRTGELVGQQPFERLQCGMDGLYPPPCPAQHPGQLDVGTQILTRRLQARCLLGCAHHRIDLAQGPRQPRRQTVRQQTEGAMPFWTVPAGYLGSRRGNARIGPVAGKPAATLGVQRTARQACLLPGTLANVFLAGQLTGKAQLHRPRARTATTVAGLLLSRRPAILPHRTLLRRAVVCLGSCARTPARFPSPQPPLHR